MGLSNVSFGLHPYARQVVNSVFLHYCLEAGLDSAILHAAKIIPLARIDEKGRDIATRLIFNDRSEGDPLQQLTDATDIFLFARSAEAGLIRPDADPVRGLRLLHRARAQRARQPRRHRDRRRIPQRRRRRP